MCAVFFGAPKVYQHFLNTTNSSNKTPVSNNQSQFSWPSVDVYSIEIVSLKNHLQVSVLTSQGNLHPAVVSSV